MIYFLKIYFPVIFVVLINNILSFYYYQTKESILAFEISTYIYGQICGIFFWFYLFSLRFFLKSYLFLLYSIFYSMLFTVVIFSNYFVYVEFRQFIGRDMLIFIFEDLTYLINYISTYFYNINGLYFILFIVLIQLFWYTNKLNLKLDRKKLIFLVVTPLFILALLNNVRHADSRIMLPMDTAFFVGLKRSIEPVKKSSLYASFDRDKPEIIEASSYDIVLIINESWSKEGLSFYNKPSKAIPNLENWIITNKSNFLIFNDFYSNSGATDLSVPSIVTGVGPFESNKKLHDLPFLWDWAKSAGMHTLYVTSQRYTWQNFQDFMFTPGPDKWITALELNSPIVNDLGVDDLIAVNKLQYLIENADREVPLFAIYNSNALHAPFQQYSDLYDIRPEIGDPWKNALYIIDHSVDKLKNSIEKRGTLHKTFFIITSDHAGYGLKKKLPRIESHYNEALQIPFIIYIPDKFIKNNQDAFKNLRNNQNHLASNLDIVPTLTRIMGYKPNSIDNYSLIGKDLTMKYIPEKVVISNNANEIKKRVNIGFGIYTDKYRFVASNLEGFKLFSSDDSEQKQNIWENEGLYYKNIHEIINHYPILKELYSKIKSDIFVQ